MYMIWLRYFRHLAINVNEHLCTLSVPTQKIYSLGQPNFHFHSVCPLALRAAVLQPFVEPQNAHIRATAPRVLYFLLIFPEKLKK